MECYYRCGLVSISILKHTSLIVPSHMKVYILYILKILNLLHTPIKSYEGKHFPYIRFLKECFFTAKLFHKWYKKKKKERERRIDREREKKKERERNIENVREREIEKVRE